MKKIYLVILLVLVVIKANAQPYSIHSLQGVWVVVEDVSNEGRCGINEEFYIFKDNNKLFVSTYRDWLDQNVILFKYGFSDSPTIDSITQLRSIGRYYIDAIKYNEKIVFQNALNFSIQEKHTLFYYMEECSYLEKLPKKAQIVLYKRSLYDHRNYAREFLDYDICGIKTEDCQLLDSLQQPIGIAIPKDEIVVVRNNCGDLLQVEYEPASDKFVSGYLRREDLQFVEIEN